MNKKIITLSIVIVATILIYLQTTKIPLGYNYADITEKSQEGQYQFYSFKDGKVYLNDEEIGAYSRFYNTITLNFIKSVNGCKEAKGEIVGRTRIILTFKDRVHKLNLSKG